MRKIIGVYMAFQGLYPTLFLLNTMQELCLKFELPNGEWMTDRMFYGHCVAIMSRHDEHWDAYKYWLK